MSKHYLPFKKGTKLTVTQGDRQTNHSNLGYVAYDFWTNGDRTLLSIVKGTIVHLGTGYNSGWGNSITIKAEDGTFYRYAHLRDNPYSKHTIGKPVTIGTELGIMGNTGNVSGPTGIHLHLEKLRYFNSNPGKGSGGMKIDFFEDGYLEKNEIVYSQHPGLTKDWINPVNDPNTTKIGDYYVTVDNFFDPVADISYHNGQEIIFRQDDGQVKAFLTNEKGFAFWYHHTGWADSNIPII